MNPNILFTHLTSAAALAYLMQILQSWKAVPWVTRDTTKINTILRAVLAAGATVGIGVAWTSSAGGGHQLTIAIPSIGALAHAAFSAFGQYALQHGWENILIPKPPLLTISPPATSNPGVKVP
jgi:hypothetical protein